MTPPASPTQSRWTAIALLLAGSVGVPGLVSYFNPDIAKNPKTAIPLLILWELLVLIAGLVTDVWSKLRSRWVDRLVDPIDHALQALFSRYRRRYLDWIFYRHRDFDVKGLTTQSTYNLELEQVFVDLTIQPPPPGGTPTDPLRSFPKELTGRRSIWDYLTSESFTDHLALIGAPGSGKTTLLKKIALQMTGHRRPKIRQKLPILLFLREHTEAILANPSPSLADLASADLARKHCSVLPPAAWFKGKLDDGRCLVLLDGLDEVASQDVRQKVVTWVENQIKAFPRNRFLISSRPHGYRSSPVSGVTLLEIQPFNRDQVRQFVQNWYRANEIHASGKLDPGVEMKAREGAEDLLRRLGNTQTLTDLAVNPLLLTMIANVHRFRSSLPGRRVELYAEICEVFLGKRRQAQGIETDLTPAQKQRVLQPLAYHLMCAKKREIPSQEAMTVIAESLRRVAGERSGSPEADFLKEIENGSGLLLERESGVYSFAHLAFQEYLTAVHIRENGLAGELEYKVADPWWHEVIRLYGAQGDASGVLAACLSSESPSVAQLSLAIDCLEEAREAAPEWRAKIDTFLREGAESTDPDRFRLAAETMLARRLRSMVAINERTFVDSDYISHAEYQLFLDEMRALSMYHQPDHWVEFRFRPGQALTSAVGMRSSDARAFCNWLQARDGNFDFRLPQYGEMKIYEVDFASKNLPGTAEGFWTNDGFARIVWSHDRPRFSYTETLISRDLLEKGIPARARTTTRSRAQTLDLARNVAVALGRNRDVTSSLIRGLARSVSLSLNLPPNLEHILQRVAASYRNRHLDLDRAINSVFGIEPDIGMDSALDFGLSRNLGQYKSYQDIRWTLRVLSLYLATRSDPNPRPLFEKWFFRRQESFNAVWLHLYQSLVLLEARIDGMIPATEGIRIIKERRS
jgi:hypothetical protein